MGCNVEIQLSMECHKKCPNCNRLCHLFPDRTEHIPHARILALVEELRNRRMYFGKCKLVGGDPLKNPDFLPIYHTLLDAVGEGYIGQLKIETQEKRPDVPDHPRVRWMGKSPRKKCHLPVLWSPKDMGFDTHGPCAMTRRCGASLDIKGWLPCSMAIALARCFDLEHLYRQEIPVEPWGLDLLCGHCVFSMPPSWAKEHSYPILATPPDHVVPTKSWKEGLQRYAEKLQ